MISKNFDQLVKTVAQLRDPENGCPWDLEQTHLTLADYLEEESQEVKEVLDTFDEKNPEHYESLKEELGDVLLQVMLHAQIASESGHFDVDDILETLTDKLIRRHPHVFGESDASTVAEVERQWKEIKAKEKADKEQKKDQK